MSDLVLSSEFDDGFTSVSNKFITEYLPAANGEFTKIYLYLLYLTESRRNKITVPLLADTFNQTEADVMRALRYWDKLGIIILSFDGSGKELNGITLKSLQQTSDVPKKQKTNKSESVSPVSADTAPVALIEPSKIQYTPEKLNQLAANEEFSMLLYVVQSYYGRPLSNHETNSIVYFYDTLHFSAELIEFLFEYCIERDKKSINYIEAVAMSWAGKNIHTIDEAKAEVYNNHDVYYQIMKAFGLANREPGQSEKDFITKWCDVYCFKVDIIIEACNRTLKAIHMPSFQYADTILNNWKKNNVTCMDDIKAVDKQHAAGIAKTKNSSSAKNNNRFNNFQQRSKKPDDFYNSLLSNNR